MMMMMMILLSHKDDNRLLPAWTRSRFYRLTCRATPRFANGSTAKPTWRPNCGTHTSSVCMTAASTKVSSRLPNSMSWCGPIAPWGVKESPLQRGQVGQPSPEPVRRTAPPVTTRATLATRVAQAKRRSQMLTPTGRSGR